jgi:hypothetical protein
MLRIDNLVKSFAGEKALGKKKAEEGPATVFAVNDVTFEVYSRSGAHNAINGDHDGRIEGFDLDVGPDSPQADPSRVDSPRRHDNISV